MINPLTSVQLRSFSNPDLRAYEARLLAEVETLRGRALAADWRFQAALDDLREGGDYYLAEALSLTISLGGIVTFQWIAIAGGVSALYASVRSRWKNPRDPIRRIVSITGEMRRVRNDATRLRHGLNRIVAEKRLRAADPDLGWP